MFFNVKIFSVKHCIIELEWNRKEPQINHAWKKKCKKKKKNCTTIESLFRKKIRFLLKSKTHGEKKKYGSKHMRNNFKFSFSSEFNYKHLKEKVSRLLF